MVVISLELFKNCLIDCLLKWRSLYGHLFLGFRLDFSLGSKIDTANTQRKGISNWAIQNGCLNCLRVFVCVSPPPAPAPLTLRTAIRRLLGQASSGLALTCDTESGLTSTGASTFDLESRFGPHDCPSSYRRWSMPQSCCGGAWGFSRRHSEGK
jgi:hypothetical protein